MRLKDVFFENPPIVLSLARSTMFSSTTLFSNNRNVLVPIEAAHQNEMIAPTKTE